MLLHPAQLRSIPSCGSLTRRNLILLENFPIFYVILHLSWKKRLASQCFPESSMKALPSSFKHIAVHKKTELSFNLMWTFIEFTYALCYISVDFTVLWCPCQIFSLNESFNSLLDDYRTGEESCSQLLCDLWRQHVITALLIVYYCLLVFPLKCNCFNVKNVMFM